MGIEVLTIDARIVIASVDTYLRFAEATNRLDLAAQGGKDITELMGGMAEEGSQGKTKGAVEGLKDAVTPNDDDDEEEEEAPRRRQRQSSKSE